MNPLQLIREGRLREALEALSKTIPAYQQSEVILLQSRLSNLETSERMGTLGRSDATIERNRIMSAAMSLVGERGFSVVKPSTKEERKAAHEETGELHTGEITPLPPKTGKTKILFLAANPKEEERAQTDVEHRTIKQELSRGRARDEFEFLPSQFAVTITELLRAMSDKPEIIHFSGHGEKDGILIVDDNNYAHPIPLSALKRMFKRLQGVIRIVMLNACYSADQAKEISKFGPYVVGYSEAVKDTVALNFSIGFYIGLGEGKSFEEAYDDAMIVIETKHPEFVDSTEVWKDGKQLDL